MTEERIIYANDINGICPFCGCDELLNDIYGSGVDSVIKSVTCSSCYSTFPVRDIDDTDKNTGVDWSNVPEVMTPDEIPIFTWKVWGGYDGD
jgi:hypothetical protein